MSLSTGEVILIVVLATIPIAFASFVLGAGDAFRQIGKGPFAVEFDSDLGRPIVDDSTSASPQEREAEIRQLLEAKAYRQRARGEQPLDVESELGKAIGAAPGPAPQADPNLAEEVRQLVIARNERRIRQGREPLDVAGEVERQLRELENLGQ
ncbi:MAG: hypothetical protein ACRDK1_10805 [Solirubrobacterales bacterium]